MNSAGRIRGHCRIYTRLAQAQLAPPSVSSPLHWRLQTQDSHSLGECPSQQPHAPHPARETKAQPETVQVG